jgi:hypothetical protein
MEFLKNGVVSDGVFFSLDEITRACLEAKVKEENLVLLHIEWQSDRSFDGAYEIVVYTAEKAKKVMSLIVGQECDFGEINGKHSNVSGTVDEEDVVIDSNVENVVSFLKDSPSGTDYNYSFLDCMADNNKELEDLVCEEEGS